MTTEEFLHEIQLRHELVQSEKSKIDENRELQSDLYYSEGEGGIDAESLQRDTEEFHVARLKYKP